MDFGGGDFGGLFDFGHHGGGHHGGGHYDGGFHHGSGHHSGGDMSWLWAGGADVIGDGAAVTTTSGSAASRSSDSMRIKPPLLLSAGAGVASGLLTDNPKATFVASLLSGAAIPYAAMHKPNLVEVGLSAGASVLAGAITQQAKHNWQERQKKPDTQAQPQR